MRGIWIMIGALSLLACGVTGPVSPPGGTVQGLVDTQRSITHRLPGQFRTTVTRAGVSRAGDLGYTIGRWSLRVDDLPQFTDAAGGFLTVWAYVDGRWRPLVDGRSSTVADAGDAAAWDGANDAAAATTGRGAGPPAAEEWLAGGGGVVHVHGIQIADSDDVAVQWGERIGRDGRRDDWILLWIRGADGWQLRHRWNASGD